MSNTAIIASDCSWLRMRPAGPVPLPVPLPVLVPVLVPVLPSVI